MNTTPTPTPSIMVTEQSNPAAMAAVRAIKGLPEEAEAAIQAIKDRAKAEVDELNKVYNAKHRDAWNALESALDLNSDDNHSLCTDHLDDHGMAFVTITERKMSPVNRGIGGELGAMLAQALGGRVLEEGPMGGMIEIKGEDVERFLGNLGGGAEAGPAN